MSKPLAFEKPNGFHDLLPDILRKKRMLEQRLLKTIASWGYEEIQTPSVEFLDTIGDAISTQEHKLFKLFDQQGRTLVLRPDMTAPIARVTASLLKDKPFPIRLMYCGNVFRAPVQGALRNAEFTHLGVELIGDSSLEADGEVIALAVELLHQAGISSLCIAVSHIGFLQGLFREWVNDPELEQNLRHSLHDRDYVGFRRIVRESRLPERVQQVLLDCLELRGGREILDKAAGMSSHPLALQAISEMEMLAEILGSFGMEEKVLFDLTMIARLNYYTGILFEGYVAGVGSPVLSGGRYDHLVGQFGREAPATGFALKIDRILEISPLEAEVPHRILILYGKEDRARAYRMAREKREEGIQVITHCTDHGPFPGDRDSFFEVIQVGGERS